MATLENKLAKNTYKDLLKINSASDNSGIDSTLRAVEDGDATASALQLSTTAVKSTGTLEVAGASTLTGNATIGGTLGVSGTSTLGSIIKVIDDRIEDYSSESNSGAIAINYLGFSGGSAYYRNFKVYNGKSMEVFRAVGSSGNVLINTSTDSGYKLDVNGTGRFSSSVTATSFITSSDERVKENIENANLQTCFENVKNLKLKRFNFKNEVFSDEQIQDRTQLGFIAQEVEPIFPKAVFKNDLRYNQKYEDVIVEAKFDENGIETEKERIEKKLISEDTIVDCFSLNKDQIIMSLYGAVQKLIEKVEILEAK